MQINLKVHMAKSSSANPALPTMPPSPTTPSATELIQGFRDVELGNPNVVNTKNYVSQNSWIHNSDHSHRSHKRIYVFMAVLFCLILGINAILLLLLPHWTYDNVQYSCVECDSLRLSSDPMDDYSIGFETKLIDNVWICCAQNASQQRKILEAYVERSVRTNWVVNSQALAHVAQPSEHTPNLHNDTTAPPVENPYAAHLFLEEEHFTQTSDLTIIRGWADPHGAGDLNFVRSGILYNHDMGRFTITQSGLYSVYSHLVFKGLGSNSHLFSQVIAREQTGVSAPAGPQPLLEDAEWVSCDPMQTLPCYTSHLSSQLFLKKGDHIYVYAKPAHQLKADRRSSYFGLYFISA